MTALTARIQGYTQPVTDYIAGTRRAAGDYLHHWVYGRMPEEATVWRVAGESLLMLSCAWLYFITSTEFVVGRLTVNAAIVFGCDFVPVNFRRFWAQGALIGSVLKALIATRAFFKAVGLGASLKQGALVVGYLLCASFYYALSTEERWEKSTNFFIGNFGRWNEGRYSREAWSQAITYGLVHGYLNVDEITEESWRRLSRLVFLLEMHREPLGVGILGDPSLRSRFANVNRHKTWFATLSSPDARRWERCFVLGEGVGSGEFESKEREISGEFIPVILGQSNVYNELYNEVAAHYRAGHIKTFLLQQDGRELVAIPPNLFDSIVQAYQDVLPEGIEDQDDSTRCLFFCRMTLMAHLLQGRCHISSLERRLKALSQDQLNRLYIYLASPLGTPSADETIRSLAEDIDVLALMLRENCLKISALSDSFIRD